MNEIPIPPEPLRFMRDDEAQFASVGDLYLSEALKYVVPSTVLDVGCGYGRFAYALHRRRFGGRYHGVDILQKHITWLRENFSPVAPNFQFEHKDVRNNRYNREGSLETKDIAFAPGFIPDLTTLLSVFTHMYEDDIATYLAKLREAVVDSDSIILATFFLLTGDQGRRPNFHFTHRINDHCFYFEERDPLHAVAYDEDWVRDLLDRSGFECVDLSYAFQDIVVLSPR